METQEISFLAHGRKLDDSELRAAFASVHVDTPIWQAVRQTLLEELEDAINETVARAWTPDHGPLAASVGGIEALGMLYDRLQKAYEAAHTVSPK